MRFTILQRNIVSEDTQIDEIAWLVACNCKLESITTVRHQAAKEAMTLPQIELLTPEDHKEGEAFRYSRHRHPRYLTQLIASFIKIIQNCLDETVSVD